MMHMIRVVAAIILVTLPVATAPTGQEQEKPRELLKPRNDLAGVKNFAQVSPVLYRGAQPTKEGMQTLKNMGIKTVVNLRWLHSDRDELKGLGLQYVHIECQAWNPSDRNVAEFMLVVRNPKNHPVFVHCQHGADRTGMMCAVYRMMEQGWPNEPAGKEIHNFGFHKVWTDIAAYLKRFDRDKFNAVIKKTKEPRVEVVN